MTNEYNPFTQVEVFTGKPAASPMAAQQRQVDSDVVGAASDQQRAIAEVQASLLIAQSCPRNETRAREKLLLACQRQRLAESALYEYKRGGTSVTGPSIRLAEAAARYYGNLDYGFREVARRPGESDVEAFCWDKESNVRVSRLFTVKHIRDKQKGGVALTQERDIYEMIASQAQRRVRSAILEIVPGDFIDDALDVCQQTLRAAVKDIGAAIKGMLSAYASIGVTREMIEKRLGRKAESLEAGNILGLRRIWTSIHDGISKPEDWFDMTMAQQSSAPAPAPAQAAEPKKSRQKKPAAPASAPTTEPEPAPVPQAAPIVDYVYELEELLFDEGVHVEDVINAGRKYDDSKDMTDQDIAHALLQNREFFESCVDAVKAAQQ